MHSSVTLVEQITPVPPDLVAAFKSGKPQAPGTSSPFPPIPSSADPGAGVAVRGMLRLGALKKCCDLILEQPLSHSHPWDIKL